MIMTILNPKGQPFILTLIIPETPTTHHSTDSGGEMALWRRRIRQYGPISPALLRHDYLTLNEMCSICSPPLIPSFCFLPNLHLYTFEIMSLPVAPPLCPQPNAFFPSWWIISFWLILFPRIGSAVIPPSTALFLFKHPLSIIEGSQVWVPTPPPHCYDSTPL